PLTLAILDGLSLSVGAETFIVPLTVIVESVRPRPEQLATIMGSGEVLLVRGDALPLIRLYDVFGVETEATDPTQALVVIVEHEGGAVALLVDELLGQQQVVVKSLESNFRKAEGIMGATILGDGRVALILDVPSVVGLTRSGGRTGRAPETAAR